MNYIAFYLLILLLWLVWFVTKLYVLLYYTSLYVMLHTAAFEVFEFLWSFHSCFLTVPFCLTAPTLSILSLPAFVAQPGFHLLVYVCISVCVCVCARKSFTLSINLMLMVGFVCLLCNLAAFSNKAAFLSLSISSSQSRAEQLSWTCCQEFILNSVLLTPSTRKKKD